MGYQVSSISSLIDALFLFCGGVVLLLIDFHGNVFHRPVSFQTADGQAHVLTFSYIGLWLLAIG